MHRLAISLLGPFEVTLDGEPVTRFGADTARALLAYLALHPRTAHRRETLAGLLWPDQPEAEARHNLAQALNRLRQAIGDRTAAPPFLEITRQTIGLHPEGDAWVDVAAFWEALATCRGHGHRRIETCDVCAGRLEAAASLYRGEFMAGFSLDSALFEEWLVVEREELHRGALDVLRDLAGYHEAQGAYEEAIRYARRQIELEGWREEAHRQVMRGLALSGDRGGAMAQYEACRRTLEVELGVEPEGETQALYERIRTGEELQPQGALPPHNLPAYLTPFVGRKEYLTEIADRLADPACRLLTLVGPGGIGKTRLAVEAARGQIGCFKDGAFFISFAALGSPEEIVSTVAQALGLVFHQGRDPRQQLFDYLREREMLLVLDNLEHLLDDVSLIAQILRVAPAVKIVSTSRARLNVQIEHLLPVAGVDYPPLALRMEALVSGESRAGQELPKRVIEYSAVELFLQSARRVRRGLELGDDDVAHVAQICCLVQGMPLAIILAAAWMEVLSPAEIATEIERGLDFLETDLRDLLERQRSIVAVFDASWKMLGDAERAAFARLSAFRGGFTREAAQAVAGVGLRTLKALAQKSFLTRDGTGRYEVHELLRQYGEIRLGEIPGERERTHDRHCAYYAAFCDHREAATMSGEQREVLLEIDNIRTALRWATVHSKATEIHRFSRPLFWVYSQQGWQHEAEATLDWVVGVLRTGSVDGQRGVALGSVLGQLGFFTAHNGHPENGAKLVQEGLFILRKLDARPQLAGCMIDAVLAHLRSDYPEAKRLLQESLAIYREMDDRLGMMRALGTLGLLAMEHEVDYPEAERYCREALTIGRELDDRQHIAWALAHLGRIVRAQGKYRESKRLLEEGLSVAQESGHPGQVAIAIRALGDTVFAQREYREAQGYYQEALDYYRDWGDYDGIALSSCGLGDVALALGDDAAAMEHYRQALRSAVGILAARCRLSIVVGLAALLARTGFIVGPRPDERGTRAGDVLLHKERAAELAAMALHHPSSIGTTRDRARRLLDELQAELQPDIFSAAQECGRARDLDATVAELLAELEGRPRAA
jgi:predicted ATPase/DNA-binding SARP family transcriptional activator